MILIELEDLSGFIISEHYQHTLNRWEIKKKKTKQLLDKVANECKKKRLITKKRMHDGHPKVWAIYQADVGI